MYADHTWKKYEVKPNEAINPFLKKFIALTSNISKCKSSFDI